MDMKTNGTLILIFLAFVGCAFTVEEQLDNLPQKDAQQADETLLEALPPLDSFKYELPWLVSFEANNMIVNRILTPIGYERMAFEKGSFQHWLTHLPLLSGTPEVMLYNGNPKGNQSAHAYVLDIDVGTKDLQQCADATMRLRAEYLFNNGKSDSIAFNYTNGAKVSYSKWKQGFMPVPKNSTVTWVASSKAGKGYEKFKEYMIQVFNYAGTLSLSKELKSIDFEELRVGDLIIKGGSPGHAVMVMDMAINDQTGDKVFLLSQSYMPAQQIQILKNPNNSSLSPWYSMNEISDVIETPEWTFTRDQIKRWN
jgi:hypothetical protein